MSGGVARPELGAQPRGFGPNSFPAKALASAAQAANGKKVCQELSRLSLVPASVGGG